MRAVAGRYYGLPPSGDLFVPVHDPPLEQVWPVVVQSLQVAPRVPHVELLIFMQRPP
jgi:hypothetical protein